MLLADEPAHTQEAALQLRRVGLDRIEGTIAGGFDAWTGAVRTCLEQAEDRFPADSDLQSLAEFTLTVMEGAVMQARTYRDVAFFDRAIAQIRLFYDSLMRGRKE